MEVIRFDNVYYSYEEEEQADDKVFAAETGYALNGVDFSAREGEFVAVLGHNGSGKSTLARLANGLLTPTQGKVTAFGLDTQGENLFDIRKQVGIVFQNPDNQMVASIVEDDIAFGAENIGLPREEIGQRIEFALSAVGMTEFRNATPNRLSGGQKQRIAIAGVLALKPRVMILDEATAMLDPKGRKEVMDVVLRLNKEEKITVVLITHFPEEALLADRAIVMHQGKIVMEGTPKDILSRGEDLKEYSLTMPHALRVCDDLQRGGLAVENTYDVETLADNIYAALKKPLSLNAEEVVLSTSRPLPREREEETEVGRIYAERLSYVYNPSSAFETHALFDASLEIKSGDFFGIIGHTGSGKSTFVQHLNALLKVPTAEKKYKPKKLKKGQTPPEPVRLTVNGYDLTDKKTDFKELRSRVGMVFQYPEYQLFAETVFDDVAFGLKNFKKLTKEETEAAVKEALTTVGLDYEGVKERSPFELSGGQKRRVAIAGVIVTKPEILVLDEPAAGLDPLGKKEIMTLLHQMHAEWCKTVVIVSHDMDEIAENCNRAAIFSEGRTVAVGTPEELFHDGDELRALGLDIPFVAKLAQGLRERGVAIKCKYVTEDFVAKTLAYAKSKGAGTSLSPEEGGQANA